MTDETPEAVDAVETALERARELPDEEALSVLESARRDLEAHRKDAPVDEDRLRALEDRLSQRIREVDERDAYDAGLGASMEPEDEDAP